MVLYNILPLFQNDSRRSCLTSKPAVNELSLSFITLVVATMDNEFLFRCDDKILRLIEQFLSLFEICY